MVLCLQGEVLSSIRACPARVFESIDREDGESNCCDVSNDGGGTFESKYDLERCTDPCEIFDIVNVCMIGVHGSSYLGGGVSFICEVWRIDVL